MPTSDDLKQRLNSAATQEHSEFAMALLVSEVIDTHLDCLLYTSDAADEV